jgi:hypothetical protein
MKTGIRGILTVCFLDFFEFLVFQRLFLIDHAWTYRINEAREHLIKYEGLVERMCNLMQIPVDDDDDDETNSENKKNRRIELIVENMWKYNQTYNLTFENMVILIWRFQYKQSIFYLTYLED